MLPERTLNAIPLRAGEAANAEIEERDRRRRGVVGQRGRVDDGNATLRRKPEAAILCANAGGLTESIRLRAGHAVLATVQHRRDRALPTGGHRFELGPRDAVDSDVGTDPEVGR